MLKLTMMNNRPPSRFSSHPSSSRSSPRLACRRAGRCRSRRSLLRCYSVAPRPYHRRPRIARASRLACRGAKRMPWLVSWAYSSCGCGALSFSSCPPLVPCLLVEGRSGVCVGIVDCPFCIYNSPAVCYSINVEREQTKGRHHEERRLHHHGGHRPR